MTVSEQPLQQPPAKQHFGIAGAGLLGRLMAWQLLRQGHAVTLFDKDTVNGESAAGRVAAAMLAPYSEAVSCEREIFDWGLQSMQLWPELLQQLQQDLEQAPQQDNIQTVSYQQRGSVVIAHQQDQSSLSFFNQQLRSLLPDYLSEIEFCDRQRLHTLEPELADKFNQATFLGGEGCVDNWALLDNLALAIKQLGGVWYEQVVVEHLKASEILCAGQKHHFDCVIDSRGFGAKNQLTDLRGVRGEVLWVKAPEVNLSRPVRLIHPRYQLYIAPKPNKLYVIGATEIESESMEPITIRSSLELQSALYSIHSGFAEANVIRAFANCRPAFLDNLPRIDYELGFMSINGLYRHGYLLSPLVIKTAMEALAGNVQHAMVRPQSNRGSVANANA